MLAGGRPFEGRRNMKKRIQWASLVGICLLALSCSGSESWQTIEQWELQGHHEKALKAATARVEHQLDGMQPAAAANVSINRDGYDPTDIARDILALTHVIENDEPNKRVLRGFIFATINSYDEAIADFTAAADADSLLTTPDLPVEGRIQLCLLCAVWQNGDRRAALSGFTDFLSHRPSHARAYFYHGVLSLQTGDEQTAIADFKQAMLLGDRQLAPHMLAELRGQSEGTMSGSFLTAIFEIEEDRNASGYNWMIRQVP